MSRGTVEHNRQISSRVGVRIGKCVTVCVFMSLLKVLKHKEKYSSTVYGRVKYTM